MIPNWNHRGFWLEYPSLLEPAPGPWMGARIHELSTIEAWRHIIDWMAEQGADTLVTGLPGHFKHPTTLENSYHYLLDCKPFPEAACNTSRTPPSHLSNLKWLQAPFFMPCRSDTGPTSI